MAGHPSFVGGWTRSKPWALTENGCAAGVLRTRLPGDGTLRVSGRTARCPLRTPSATHERAVSEHLMIGLAAVDILKGQRSSLHSRKLRSFDEPPFR